MTTATIEQTETKPVRIIMPKNGMIKDKDGKSIYGMLPYVYEFTDRESYLAWRKVWKETYLELTQEIREAKKIRGTHGHEKQNWMTYEAAILRIKARNMMQILQDGKQLSGQMRAARLAL